MAADVQTPSDIERAIRAAVTSIDKRVAILEIDDLDVRANEAWASGFSCPNCGRCTYRMVNTAKNCTICGEGTFRLGPLVTPKEAREWWRLTPRPAKRKRGRQVEPVGGVSDTASSDAPDRPATDHNVAESADGQT